MNCQNLSISIQELYELIEALEETFDITALGIAEIDNDKQFQIKIINKQSKYSVAEWKIYRDDQNNKSK